MKYKPENTQQSLLMEFRRTGENRISEKGKNISLECEQGKNMKGSGLCVCVVSFFLSLYVCVEDCLISKTSIQKLYSSD